MVLGGNQDGFDLVAGSKPDAIEQFTVICSRGVPRLLLPPSSSLMRTAMTRFLGGRRITALITPFLQCAAWIGGPFSYLSSNVSLMSQTGEPSPLRQLISNVIGHDEFQLALRVSFDRPNAKTVAMAISPDGEVLCYLKLGSETMTSSLVAHESAILKQFESSELPVITPACLYSGTWVDGQSVLITAPLQLEPLKADACIAHSAADALVSQTMDSSSALVNSAYWRRIVDHAGKYEVGESLPTAVAEIERSWGDSDFDFGISHGDWTRANVGMVGERVAALDWERCHKSSPRGVDIAHFAISEKTSRPFSKSLDIDQVADKVRLYLKSAGLLPDKAEVLILFALLEMVIRFKFAEDAGLRSNDVKFGPALQEGVKKWAS